MNFETLKSIDNSFNLLNGNEKDLIIEEVITPPFFVKDSLVLAKSKKFYNKIIESYSLNQKKEILLVVNEKMKNDLLGKEDFLAVATVKNVESFMIPLSKKVFDLRYLKLEDLSDNDSKIHESAMIHKSAVIGKGVKICANTTIMANSTIGDGVEIGDGTIIFANVALYPFVKIGKNCRIHSGTVIGADGFGYNFSDGVHHKIWHSGGVVIDNDVEIGALTAIDGGTFIPTQIGRGTKIDNHVQVGHNVSLGSGVILCGHVGLSGSVKVGDFTVFGGYSGCGPGITIGAMSQIAGGALINCDWPEKSVLGGHPARPLNEWMKGLAYLRKVSLNESEKK